MRASILVTVAAAAAALALLFGGPTLGSSWSGAEEEDAQPAQPAPRRFPFGFVLPFRGSSYALDEVSRYDRPDGTLPCPVEALVRHRGTHVRYQVPARVHEAFLPRLERFEAIVAEVAVEHFGRAPRRLLHGGAYNCRTSRGRAERLSEHALGNALDLRGFDFGPLPRKAEAPEALPRSLRRAFDVRIGDHWNPRRERDVPKSVFLRDLVARLREAPDLFRGMVGPPRPRHHDHLHLDVAPWRYSLYRFEPLPQG